MKRKWFIGILILAVVGAVLAVVFVNMFTSKSTSPMAEDLNFASSSGYLCVESDEYKDIIEYFDNVSTALNAESDDQDKVVSNCKNLYIAFSKEAGFINKQLAFSEYTNTYKNSIKNVERLLKNAQKNANEAKIYIKNKKTIVGSSPYWTAGTWYECKDYILKMIKDTNRALKLVDEVYSAGVKSKLTNNNLSTLIFQTTQALADEAISNIETQNSSATISNFSQIYFTDYEIIMSYQYNASVREKIDTIFNAENRAELAAYQEFLEGNLN